MATLTLTVTLATLAASGRVDREASLTACETALDQFIAEKDTQDETIAEAVNAVFDKYPGVNINMPALNNYAMQELNALPSNHAALSERVLAYVRENADRHQKTDKKTKAILQAAEAPRTRLFCITNGKGGGVKRWSDVPASETEATASA
jgi:hypothetical protein